MANDEYSKHLYRPEPRAAAGSERLSLQGPAGHIEALLDTPTEDRGRAVAIVCHPHPLYGGTMHNKVVHFLSKTFNNLGMPALRFNFRGVGETEGAYDEGVGETDDVLAITDAVAERFPGRAVWLAGLSFGAYVALRASSERDYERLITVAPAVNLYDFSQLTLPGMPWILVQGDQDEVVPSDQVAAWVEQLDQPPEMLWLEGAGHFFHGRLTDLRDGLIERLTPSGAAA